MLKKKLRRHKTNKREKRTSSRFVGGVALLVILMVAVGLAVAMVFGPAFEEPTVPAPIANSCLDFDPPSVLDTVIFNSIQYDAIKKNAGIVSSKMNEMQKVGNLDGGGADVYRVKSGNYFGEKVAVDIIYVLRSQNTGYYFFDIYIKDGDQIPPEIKNSKNVGGEGPISVVIDDSSQFPPAGFDVSQIKNLSISITNPSFVYGSIKTTVAEVNKLSGVKIIGSVPTTKGDLPLYYHLGTAYIADGNDAYEYLPVDTLIGFTGYSAGKSSLQLRKFTLKKASINPVCWYTPSCKPAVYLYPKKRMAVNVKVTPKGYFTYTKPKYPEGSGWQVTANPDGTIESDNELLRYLYYESKIRDFEIRVPTEGYVVAYDKLPELYSQLLPKLGLSSEEITDFKEYWDNILPKAPYYFVGILDRDNIDSIEKMSILPQPDSIVRVRIYFEALEEKREVKEPSIEVVVRQEDGFNVVEWGGLVKSDPDSPFTCSQ